MKEREVPTRDLKNGAKVVGAVASGTFDAAKPYLKRSIESSVAKTLRKFRKRII